MLDKVVNSMTNADKFKSIFGLYATELWAKPEKDFLEWLNADAELFGNSEQLVVPHRNYKYLSDYWCKCGWHLGKRGDVNYCANCGRKVIWDGRYHFKGGGD